jgi:hypothetical protein
MRPPKVIGLFDALLELWADVIIAEISDPRNQPPYESDDFAEENEETSDT